MDDNKIVGIGEPVDTLDLALVADKEIGVIFNIIDIVIIFLNRSGLSLGTLGGGRTYNVTS